MPSKKRLFFLFLAILCSILAMASLDFSAAEEGSAWNALMISGPGVFYSIYLITAIPRKLRWIDQIGIFLLLFCIWLFSFGAAFATWGLGLPILGAVSAILVEKIVFTSKEPVGEKGKQYLITGGLCGLAGYVGFILMLNFMGLELESIWLVVLFWQLGIGVLIEKQKAALFVG